MSSRPAWIIAACAALGAACADEGSAPPSQIACTFRCDDGDPCTDDQCDVATDTCVFLPRDVQHACRTDQHCDDGNTCTVDTCAVDDCGLERCRSDVADGCEVCRIDDECGDENGCTIDRCELRESPLTTPGSAQSISGFCAHTSVTGCDPRCDPLHDVGPDLVRAVGSIHSRCTGECPCEGPLVLSIAEGGSASDDLVLTLDGASCTSTGCGPDAAWDCAPLVPGPTYTVWGTPILGGAGEGGIAVEGYCMAGVHLLSSGWYAGEVVITGAGTARFSAKVFVDGHSSIELTPEPCDECTLEIVSLWAEYGIREGQAHVFELELVVRGTTSNVHARLHATPTGAFGAITSETSDVTGTLRLDWAPRTVEGD